MVRAVVSKKETSLMMLMVLVALAERRLFVCCCSMDLPLRHPRPCARDWIWTTLCNVVFIVYVISLRVLNEFRSRFVCVTKA